MWIVRLSRGEVDGCVTEPSVVWLSLRCVDPANGAVCRHRDTIPG